MDEGAGVGEAGVDLVSVQVDGGAEGVGGLDPVGDRGVGGAELEPALAVVGLGREVGLEVGDAARGVARDEEVEGAGVEFVGGGHGAGRVG